MASRKQVPARSPEARENQLINLAVDEAERRLKNGTASSQIVTLLLKNAMLKTQLELEKLRSDIALQKAKQQEIADKATSNLMYEEALAAFKSYKGDYDEYSEEEEYDDYL